MPSVLKSDGGGGKKATASLGKKKLLPVITPTYIGPQVKPAIIGPKLPPVNVSANLGKPAIIPPVIMPTTKPPLPIKLTPASTPAINMAPAETPEEMFASWLAHPELQIGQGAEVAPISSSAAGYFEKIFGHNTAVMPIQDTNFTAPPKKPEEQVDWTGGGGGYATKEEPATSGSTEPAGPGEPSWAETYHIPGAPDWWRGVTPSFSSPELEYAGLLNSMIPFLSSEDQRSMATYLYTLYPDAFGTYNATLGNFQGAPTQQFDLEGRRINTQTNGIPYLGQAFSDSYTRNTYSQERANAMLAALDTVASKMPKTGGKMGPGYAFLKQVSSAVRDLGAVGNAMPTHQQLTQLVAALDPLIAMTQSDTLSAYGPLVRNMTTPFMSAGRVMPVSKMQDGSYIFGEANKSLF